MGHLTSDYHLCQQTSSFYRARRHLGLIPTELAMQCMRNEEARSERMPGRRKPEAKTSKPMGRKPLAVRQSEMKVRQPVLVEKKPPIPEIDTRPPLRPIRLSYMDTMGRKSL